MYIKVVNKPKKDITSKMVKRAIEFYGDKLMGKRLLNNLDITVNFKKFASDCNEYGYCDYIDDNHHPRMFVITIANDLSMKETLLALAHEMVHVCQYAKGKMKDIFRPTRMVKWEGQLYNTDNLDYWFLPWEVEAYGMEKGLYVHFMCSLKEK